MRPTLTIRKAEPSDLPAVAALQAETIAWLASKGLDQWQPGQPRVPNLTNALKAIELGACYLAYIGAELVGTITVDDHADTEFWTPDDCRDEALYIHRMIVARRFAGRDLGRDLLDWAEELASRSGRRWLRLDAWKTNPALHRYYESQGFKHVRTINLPHRGSGALFERPVAA
jgi:ribosomal protein S18 acetylase RimI-like enzyme